MSYQGHDFYCEMVLSNRIKVNKVYESQRVLAYHHTQAFWPIHIVVIPKTHVPSLLEVDNDLLLELLGVVKQVAKQVLDTQGACRVLTNLGTYQDSKHLHWHVCSGEPLSQR